MHPKFPIRNGLLKLFFICTATATLYCVKQISKEQQHQSHKNYERILNTELIEEEESPHYSSGDAASNLTFENSKPRYFVRSTQCAMPYVDPFSADVMKVFKPLPIQNCTTFEHMVETYFDINLKRYVLHIKEHVAVHLSNYSGDIGCCYRQIIRKANSDSGYDYLPCTSFHQDFVVPLHIEGITVECYSANNTKLLQQDAFTFIQLKNLTNSSHSGTNIRKPSVLLIGIDSLSRINFKRNMVKTYEYMRRNKWHEMQGYNKIGDNTFPNLMAVMVGYNETTARGKCEVQKKGGLDNCPFIWKNFQGFGYHTAYAEDESGINTFNYCMAGFKTPPTDYYLRPYLMAFEDHLVVQKRCGLRNCIGMRHTAEYVYDFAKELGYRHIDEPIFGLFWANSFSHDCYDTPSAMDHIMLRYWEDFEESGILETSIIIFFSDHGMRWGTLTSLPDGSLEERLPMLFIWIPKWFAHQYPQYVKALEVNRNRLTSPYDLHMTLKHLVEIADEKSVKLPAAADCPQCQSLFYEVPENRNCSVAGIPDHYCTCIPYEVIYTGDLAKNITLLIIEEMNHYLVRRNLTENCSELSYRSLRFAEKRMILENVEAEKLASERLNEDSMMYRIKYKTNPNDSDFQATITYYRLNNTIAVDVESISRLNSYEKDSKCVDDKQAKKYCICRNAIVEEES